MEGPERWEVSFEYTESLAVAAYWNINGRLHGPFYLGLWLVTLFLGWQWVAHDLARGLGPIFGFFAGIAGVYAWFIARGWQAARIRVRGLPARQVRWAFDALGIEFESAEVLTRLRWSRVRELHRFARVWVLCERGSYPLAALDPAVLSPGARAFLEAQLRATRARIE